ncbi:hypothetical protein HDU76_000603 [Blyttiomyces sp. JEL0837]|nr:hypothetical protein HDU76_000603 [Blyttiomyces sp. JEL0837]
MSAISDDQLKRAFIETQQKLQQTTRSLSTLRSQVQAKERERKISELSAKELSTNPDSTISYKSVGRAFLKASLKELTDELVKKSVDAGNEVKVLQRAAEKLDREAGDAERALRELLQRRS